MIGKLLLMYIIYLYILSTDLNSSGQINQYVSGE